MLNALERFLLIARYIKLLKLLLVKKTSVIKMKSARVKNGFYTFSVSHAATAKV